MDHDALESPRALVGGPHLHTNQHARECKHFRRARAREHDATLQSASVAPTPNVVVSEPLPSIAPVSASISVSLPTTSGAFDQSPPKKVQVFIAPSLEPPLITSLSDMPPLSQLLNMLHMQVAPSAALSAPPVSPPLQHLSFLGILSPTMVDRRPTTPIMCKHKFEQGHV